MFDPWLWSRGKGWWLDCADWPWSDGQGWRRGNYGWPRSDGYGRWSDVSYGLRDIPGWSQ